ncbi:eukaryotic translation initiation factor 4 gamma 3-like isoform X2 [Takifugu flavidus]|uniref:eukaryotic translation initiation factor 4 gamma 3-like isoform X2 n=1 Tax=Takifugu flavidus TaxID=433684 RepID=UPI0025441B4C|nr:eukaryotic translation initiation factor 4 gamma 3-like isoform X2 [Takifugu flavidus]
MIWEPIIHTCVDKLLQDECEDSLECMCKLLSIVGNGLDTEAERPKLNSYYGHICLLLKEKKMSSRIKFMLQDVVALRKNNWVPCRKVEEPKTIQQLHQEVKEAEEREQLQFKNWQTTMHWRGGGRSADRGQSFHVKEVPGKVNQDSSRDCDGERKQWCHLGSSSCRGVSKIPGGVPTLRTYELLQRVRLLKKYIKEDEKQLVALNILQQLVVHIDQPDGLLRMFFDVLLDEEVIQDETFFKWKSSTVSVVSVCNFFTWFQEDG